MKVFGLTTDDHLTAPFPAGRIGMKLRLLAGDVYDPISPWALRPGVPTSTAPNWFNAIPSDARRFHASIPMLPFISFGLGWFGFYAGFKVYGFDAPEYNDYPRVQRGDVAPGSLAMCFSIRFTTHRPRS